MKSNKVLCIREVYVTGRVYILEKSLSDFNHCHLMMHPVCGVSLVTVNK